LYFGWIDADTVFANEMTQILDLVLKEGTFLQFAMQRIPSNGLQYRTKMHDVLFFGFAENQDIIQINQLRREPKIPFMTDWNVAGAFVSPKLRTRNSKCPIGVLKAVLGTSLSVMHLEISRMTR